jgi:iron complex outermembrane receptor protein
MSSKITSSASSEPWQLRQYALFLFFCFQGCFLSSQNLKDTIRLSQVEVTGSFTLHTEGFKKVRIDSNLLVQYLNTDLSTVLSQQSTIFIKSYGNGGLATPSFRGTSATHTQVQWNGINIDSPMLGQTDLSQVQVSQFESLEILYGAATVARSSGAFGGIINLVSNPNWNNTVNLTLAQTLASFNNYTTNATIALGNHVVQSITKVNYSNALNNFPFYNDQTKENEKLINAEYILSGLTQETFFRLSKTDFLTTRIWFTDDSHKIPPITTNEANVQKEDEIDQAIRSMIEWRRSTDHYFLTVRSSLVDQFMRYTLSDTSYNSHCYSWANRIRLVYSGIKNFIIRPGIDFNSDWVISDSYNGMKSRNTFAAYSEFNYNPAKPLKISLVLRQEMIDGKFQPFIPALGIEYKPFKDINLTVSANICRNYAVPTLNELYYVPDGNINLQPETDYATEGGLVYNFGKKDKNFFFETTLTGYYSRMINMILWLPDTNLSLYSPRNISEVHARGVEAGLNFAWSISGFRFSLNNAYNYCRSTNEKATSIADSSVGKQLIYTPENTFNSTLTVKRSGFYGSYVFSYIGVRYTTSDNTSFMPCYYLSNIILGKNFHLKNFIVSLQLNLNNLFDLDYQSLENRPMPGRNFSLTLKFNFNK